MNNYNKTFTLDGLVFLMNNTDDLTKHKNKYHKFIKSNPLITKYHRHVYKNMRRVIEDNNKNTIINQTGGVSVPVVFGIGSGVALSLVIAYFIYRWVSAPKCKPTYPLSKKTIDPIKLLSKVVPKSWLRGVRSSTEAVKISLDRINEMSKGLSFLNTDSTLKSIGVNVLRVTSSVALNVATMGAGGDVIISLLFTIKSVLDLMMTIVTSIVDVMRDTEGMKFIYSIFKINFLDGPFDVKCWVKYIVQEYGENSKVYKISCNFFDKILDKISRFAANALGSMIPNSSGLPAILIPILISSFREGALDMVEEKLDEYYEKIPEDIEIKIRKPRLMKKFLDDNLKYANKLSLGLGENVFNMIMRNTWTFAYFIHKFFALVYALLFIFQNCTKKDEEQ